MRNGHDALLAGAVRRVVLARIFHLVRSCLSCEPPVQAGRGGLASPVACLPAPTSLRQPNSSCFCPTRVQCALATVTLILLLLGGRGGGRRNPALPHCQPAPRAPAGSAANEGAELARLRQAYITAVRDSLTGVHLQTPAVVPGAGSELQQEPFAAEQRSGGLDWPL